MFVQWLCEDLLCNSLQANVAAKLLTRYRAKLKRVPDLQYSHTKTFSLTSGSETLEFTVMLILE